MAADDSVYNHIAKRHAMAFWDTFAEIFGMPLRVAKVNTNDQNVIDETYNVQYLRAEYSYAEASAHVAMKWKDWEKGGRNYMLQYRTANDDRVRDSHRLLHNTTLPMDDPFWNSYIPPLGWRCRCNVVRVPADEYEQSNSELAQSIGEAATDLPKQRIFRFNPGKTLKVFPPKHPYMPKGCGNCDKNLRLAYNPQSELCRACRAIAECAESNIRNYNKHDNRAEFNQQKSESKRHNKQLYKEEYRGENFYTKRVYLDKDSIDALYAHTFDSDEIRAVEDIRDILATIKNGKYLPINTQRANYREKLTRWHVKHFVQYDVVVNGMEFILNMEAIYDIERHRMYEKPYSLKKPKDE